MLRSAVEQLPEEDRTWLDQQLIVSAFSGYEQLSDALAERGYRISKSALHRYGQRFEDRMQALKLATDQARAIVQAAPDDEGAISEALMRLVQEKLFAALIEMEVDPSKLRLGSLAKSIAELGRATVTQKKWLSELREKAAAAADRAARIGAEGGASAQALDLIRREILGIAT